MQYQRTSGPVPDGFGEQFSVPETIVDETVAKTENQFAGFGLAKEYPHVVEYIRERQKYYEKYLPNGDPITTLTDAELGAWWKHASSIISEFEAFINIIEVSRDAVQQSRGR